MIERFLGWLEEKSPTLAAVAFFGVIMPVMLVGTGIILVLILAMKILIVVAAIVVALVILLSGLKYAGVDITPSAPPAVSEGHR